MASATESLPFSWQFTAGAIAGVSEICLMYPLDGKTRLAQFVVVKTRFQLQRGQAREYKSIASCLIAIIKKEGFLKLYRGILPPIAVEAPKRATKFAANEEFTMLYKRLFKVSEMTQPLSILTGVSAGITEAFIVVPFELVKIRLQDAKNSGLYSSTVDCVRKIMLHEGVFAFFRGLEATLWRHAMWNGGYFGTIHYVRNQELLRQAVETKQVRDFIAGAIGGTCGTILNTPFDVVKTRIQSSSFNHQWTLSAMKHVISEEGAMALYKGFVPKVIRLGPGGGVLLVVYEMVTNWMRSLRSSVLRVHE